jgi:hypothetical protein
VFDRVLPYGPTLIGPVMKAGVDGRQPMPR